MGHHEVLDVDVAVKYLRDPITQPNESFLREAGSLARLDHQNVVRVLDAGQLDSVQGNSKF